jgi:hypothetical protein
VFYNFSTKIWRLLFYGNGTDRTGVNDFLAIAVTTILGCDMRLAVFHFENFGAKRLAGSATNAKLFVDFWLRHFFIFNY